MKKMKYEEAMDRLEEIVERLEKGGLSLDESVKLFEEGAALAKICGDALENAEQKIINIQSAAERKTESE